MQVTARCCQLSSCRYDLQGAHILRESVGCSLLQLLDNVAITWRAPLRIAVNGHVPKLAMKATRTFSVHGPHLPPKSNPGTADSVMNNALLLTLIEKEDLKPTYT